MLKTKSKLPSSCDVNSEGVPPHPGVDSNKQSRYYRKLALLISLLSMIPVNLTASKHPADASATREGSGTEGGECVICLSADGPPYPVQGGCACRGDAGLAHTACRIDVATHQQEAKGNKVWHECGTCLQHFTGGTQLALADAWWDLVKGRQREDVERLEAAFLLGKTLNDQGHPDEAEALVRQVLAIVQGTYDIAKLLPVESNTLHYFSMLAATLSAQEKYNEAEEIQRAVLEQMTQAKGKNHPETLSCATNLAGTLSAKGQYAEAEKIQRWVLATEIAVHGKDTPRALLSADSLAVTLSARKNYKEAEPIQRGALAQLKRVMGENHPDTLTCAGNLAVTLIAQGNFEEGEQILKKTWTIEKSVLGETHPQTLQSAVDLINALLKQGKKTEAEAIGIELKSLVLSEDGGGTATNGQHEGSQPNGISCTRFKNCPACVAGKGRGKMSKILGEYDCIWDKVNSACHKKKVLTRKGSNWARTEEDCEGR